MPLIVQTVAGATQFDGTAGNGLVDWTRLDALPRTAQICLSTIAYRQPLGLLTDVRLLLGDILLLPTVEDVLLATDSVSIAQSVGGGFSFSLPGKLVPRRPNGTHFALHFFTAGKDADASLLVNWHVQPNAEREPLVSTANRPGT